MKTKVATRRSGWLAVLTVLVLVPLQVAADDGGSASRGGPLPCPVLGFMGAGVSFPGGLWVDYAPWIFPDPTLPEVGIKVYLPLPPTQQLGGVIEISGLICGALATIEEIIATFSERVDHCHEYLGGSPELLLECLVNG